MAKIILVSVKYTPTADAKTRLQAAIQMLLGEKNMKKGNYCPNNKKTDKKRFLLTSLNRIV